MSPLSFSYYFYLILRSRFEKYSFSYVVSTKKLIYDSKKTFVTLKFNLSPLHILTVFLYLRAIVVKSFDF